MAIKLDCPRCKHPLAVPSKKAGSYATCPRCQGNFWVPKPREVETPGDGSAAQSAPSAPREAPATPGSAPSQSSAAESSEGKILKPPPVVRERKVARLITADASQSAIRLAPDGQLPELYLEEGQKKDKSDGQSRSINPVVLVGVVTLSVVMSVFLVLMDTDATDPAVTAEKVAARKAIQEQYFGSGNLDRGDLKPYQLYLREAQRASARGDRKTERKYYRKVLDLLRSESMQRDRFGGTGQHARGITGSMDRDRTLEKHITTLLSGP